MQAAGGSTGRSRGGWARIIPLRLPLSFWFHGRLRLLVEGRADGIFTEDGEIYIDEIKGMYGM